jgi:hypothetical protein
MSLPERAACSSYMGKLNDWAGRASRMSVPAELTR